MRIHQLTQNYIFSDSSIVQVSRVMHAIGVILSAMMLIVAAEGRAECSSPGELFNRINIPAEYAIQAYWGAQEGSVRRGDDGHSWDACAGEDSKLWLVLQCAPPTKGLDGEDAPGLVPLAQIFADALPNDPPPLNVVDPGDWPELIFKELTGTVDHFRSTATIRVNGQEFQREVSKEGSDWSFVTTDYEAVLDGDAYGALRFRTGEEVTLEVEAGEFQLSSRFLVSLEVADLSAEMHRGCPRTEEESKLSTEAWRQLVASR